MIKMGFFDFNRKDRKIFFTDILQIGRLQHDVSYCERNSAKLTCWEVIAR